MKEKSFERKNELTEAALDEFSTKSYENASLNKIIKNAGISKGTFYYHFEDKKALYLFLHESAYKAEAQFQINRMKELAGDYAQKDFFEKLKLSAQIGVESASVFPKYMKLTITFLKESENEKNKEILEYVNNFRKETLEEGVEKMITNAMEAGELNSRFSKEFIIKIINHLFLHYTEIFGMEVDYETPKFLEDINNFVDFLKYGFGK